MKKYIFAVLGVSSLFILLIGCAIIQEKIIIKAGIKRYSPAMSSTPGIPLTVQYQNGMNAKNVNYHWTTEYGQFLRWDNRIEQLGAHVKSRTNKIYWGVDFKEKKPVNDFTVRVKVTDIKSGNTLTEAQIRIEKDQEGYFNVARGFGSRL